MLQAEFQEQQVSQPKDKHLLTFPVFHWPRQVIRPCHIEGLERHSSPWEEQWSHYKGVDNREAKSGAVFEVGHNDYGKIIIVGNKISLV